MDNNRDDFNRGGLWAFVLSVGFCAVFFIYISFIHPGVDLKEVTIVEPGQKDPAKLDLSKVEKPWIEDVAFVEQGKKVFANNCAICHGAEGLGNGAAGAALVPPPRNLVEGKWRGGGSSKALFVTLQNGLAGGSMASFKHLPKTDRWALVQFIRSITKDKVADDMSELDSFGPTAD